MNIRFSPKKIIKRVIDGESRNAFVTSGEYHGVLLKNNTISAESISCNRSYILRKSEVVIVEYLR